MTYKTLFLVCTVLSFGSDLFAMQKQVEFAAGILPYCVHNGKSYFLIGKAKHNDFWSDFGGFRDKADRSIEYAAAREFAEETRYVFGQLINDYSLEGSINYILPRIKSDQCLKSFSKSKKDNTRTNVYKMYFVEVDYISSTVLEQAKKVPHYEKEKYCWISAEDFLAFIKQDAHKTDGVFEQMSLRGPFWNNFKKNQENLPKLLSAIRGIPTKPEVKPKPVPRDNTLQLPQPLQRPIINNLPQPKIKQPQQPIGSATTDTSKGIAALLASIGVPKLAVMTVVAGLCYWGYTKYKAHKAAQEKEQEENNDKNAGNKQRVR